MAFNLPTLILEASFNANPFTASPTWTNITSYLRSWSSARGRQMNMPTGQPFDVGTATIVLDNRDGRFDPTYTGSPYYPHVIPMVRIRLRATWNAVTYPVWDMFAAGWPSTYDIGNTDEVVTVSLTDAMGVLGRNDFGGGFQPAEQTDQRIAAVIQATQLDHLPQSLDAGLTHIPGINPFTVNALQHVQDCELSEDGAFYVARDGTLTFESRYHRSGSTSQGTFGDGGGSELPYVDVSPSDDLSTIINNCWVTDANGVLYSYSDSASITKYGPQFVQISDLTDTPNEGYDRAAWEVITQKDHSWRVTQIQIMPQAGATRSTTILNNMWAQALGREVSDLITIKRRPPSGNTINQACFIERVEHSAAPGSWVTSFGVSPQPLTDNTNFFKFGNATYGKFGGPGVFGY